MLRVPPSPVPTPTPSSLLRDVPSSAALGVHPANVPSPCPGSLAQLVSTLPSTGSSDSAQLLPAQRSARAWTHRTPTDAASPTAGQGSGCTQQVQGKVQAKAPQTPQGLAGCAKHCPYPTLSPQGHRFCSQISVASTPGTPSSHFSWDLAGFAGRAVPSCLPSAQLGTPGCTRLPEGQKPHPGVSTLVCLTPGLL